MIKTGPQHLRRSSVMMSPEESRRVRGVIARIGYAAARKALGLSDATMDAARDQGRVQAVTREKILAALATAELLGVADPRGEVAMVKLDDGREVLVRRTDLEARVE